MNEQRLNLDDPGHWYKAVLAAAALAHTHASSGQQPLTERTLMETVKTQLNIVSYRNGHAAGLRRVYGGVLKGISTTKRALAYAAKH